MTEFQAKAILLAIVVLFLAGVVWGIHHSGYVKGRDATQALWNADIAKRDKAALEQSEKSRVIEAQQSSITISLKAKYEQTKTDRDSALERLRDYKLCEVTDLPRGTSLPMAENGSSAVSIQAKSTTGIDDTIALAASFNFANAVNDRDQCIALQSWVKSQGF